MNQNLPIIFSCMSWTEHEKWIDQLCDQIHIDLTSKIVHRVVQWSISMLNMLSNSPHKLMTKFMNAVDAKCQSSMGLGWGRRYQMTKHHTLDGFVAAKYNIFSINDHTKQKDLQR